VHKPNNFNLRRVSLSESVRSAEKEPERLIQLCDSCKILLEIMMEGYKKIDGSDVPSWVLSEEYLLPIKTALIHRV
jgi:hypothetical protein